ncbi:MAG: chromosomal replication initiator protein DnaA [Eubacteriales bacterium]|nr:chromosomal replication initiator protein DnaA [Eubacteriales bacterium]
MDSFNEIWEAVLAYCKERVTETAYNLWIKKTEFVSFDAATITLRLQSSMYMNVVVSQYGPMFSEAFAQIMGFDVKIKYICAEDEKVSDNNNNNEEHKFYQDKKHLEDYKNEQYTFENFIVGASNKFAYAAAKAVASDPLNSKGSFRNYNPFFIYGNSGLGKTHLLNAICHEVKKNYPEMNILYIRAEQFVNEFMQALQYKTTDEFHEKFRNNIDFLLIDDIQFIANKESTVEEFFHTFDTLVSNGKQVVVTSDRPPKDIQSITDRLQSRFEDGLLADIQPPEYETRCEIIKRKAMMLNFEISEPVVNYIAEKVKSNIRQLEGVTKKLYAYCDINQHTPTIALAQNVVKVVMEDTQPLPVTIQKIVEEVSRTTGISVDDIYSKLQKANISHARKITFYVVRKVTNMSYEDIGTEFKKHHSTVMYNIDQIEKEIETDSKLARQIQDIISNVKSGQ